MFPRAGVGGALRVVERAGEVDEMPQRDGMHRLELPQLVGVHRVRRLAVRDRKRGLPRARPDAEGGLKPRVPTFAEHRCARESFLRDALPPESDLVGRAERLKAGEAGYLRSDAHRRKLPAIAAELVYPERRHDLLDALAERLHQIAERVGVGRRDRVLEQEIRVHRIRAECERDHHVVEIADAPCGDDKRAIPAERRLGDERAMRGRDHEVRVQPRAALAHDAVIAYDHELRARAHSAGGRRAKASKRIARVLLPVAIRFKEDRGDPRVRREPGHDVVEQPRPLLTGERAEVVAAQAGPGGMATEQERRRELDPAPRVVGLRCRPRTEQDARREMLDLALAVDRGIRHDGHGFVKVVREVRTRCERAERSVVAE